MAFKEPSIRPVNTTQQDLFLLSKSGHYKTHNIDRFTALRIVLAVHVTPMAFLRDSDLIFWLMKEFYAPGIILPNREDAVDLLVNPGRIHLYSTHNYTFQQLVIHEIMDRLSTMQVLKDGDWLLPFPRPTPDAGIQKFMDDYAEYHQLLVVQPAAL